MFKFGAKKNECVIPPEALTDPNGGEILRAWVAHEGGQALGTAALRATDLPGREDLTPWLGGVYVARQFRGRGVAAALCRTVESRAAALGFQKLYLFTLDQQRLYEHLGWRAFEPATWQGRAADVMVKDLGSG